MNKKWLLKLSGSLLAVFLITGCATDDQDPAPPGTEEDGTVTDENLGGTDEMTPADETIPGETEEQEGTPGEGNEGVTENPEENMGEGQGTNGGEGTGTGTENGTGTGTENGEDEENK
jgi:hypothetical protein